MHPLSETHPHPLQEIRRKLVVIWAAAGCALLVTACVVEQQDPVAQHGYYTRPGVEYNSYGVERYDHDQSAHGDSNEDEGDGNRHRGDGVTRDDFGHCAPGLGKQGRC